VGEKVKTGPPDNNLRSCSEEKGHMGAREEGINAEIHRGKNTGLEPGFVP
jgi:hypothetical protein